MGKFKKRAEYLEKKITRCGNRKPAGARPDAMPSGQGPVIFDRQGSTEDYDSQVNFVNRNSNNAFSEYS